jgi:hypothetical protein
MMKRPHSEGKKLERWLRRKKIGEASPSKIEDDD